MPFVNGLPALPMCDAVMTSDGFSLRNSLGVSSSRQFGTGYVVNIQQSEGATKR